MAEQEDKRSPAAVALIVKEEGFDRLPRRRDEDRPERPRATKAEAADVFDEGLALGPPENSRTGTSSIDPRLEREP